MRVVSQMAGAYDRGRETGTYMDQLDNSRSKTRKVLIADDNRELRSLLGELLATFGHQVSCAENGQRALDMFLAPASQYDLVITDICMPVMSGIELIDHIRTYNREIRIIAITGYADMGMLDAVKHGCVELFYKPLNIPAFAEYIESI
ncbi:response regulator [Mariprofundus erugo]|uniref:Response regulator n=2 Tax=Mariprofundus erugo TaxID=2528639 RepID=A0A5R9GH27_9PROT|nr:response regulator [Mariprofundus erugo]